MPATIPDVFSASYEEARARFRALTRAVPHGALEVVDGLTIDWAWTGDPEARDVVVFTSGLHGIEGYAGSAAQLSLLADAGRTPTLWVHALNPWGMKHLRRVNENNVDLNRNFLAAGEAYAGANAHYVAMNTLLNPGTPPGLDAFWPRAGLYLARHGFKALKNAVVGGQYDFPQGLFFGGSALERAPRLLLDFLVPQLAHRDRVVHVELHTGIGPRGGITKLLEGNPDAAQLARVRASFGADVGAWDPDNPDAYGIRGGMTRALADALPGVRYDALTCEFGTRSNLAVLHALREENRLHQWGEPTPLHPAKQGLVEAFVPTDAAWRATVPVHARALYDSARRLLGA